MFQPLDQGIISAFKAYYKSEMVSDLVTAYSGSVADLQEKAKSAKKGQKGIKLGCNANLLDASRITYKCWDRLTSETIVNCWNHSKILPAHFPADKLDSDGSVVASSSSDVSTQINKHLQVPGILVIFLIVT